MPCIPPRALYSTADLDHSRPYLPAHLSYEFPCDALAMPSAARHLFAAAIRQRDDRQP
jgi:hypothetical protein